MCLNSSFSTKVALNVFRVELLTDVLEVVGFFEVAHTTPIASLPAKVEEALKVSGQSAVY